MSNRPSRTSPSSWDFRSRRFRALWRGHHRIPEATGSRISDSTREMGDVPSRAAQSRVGKRNSGFAGLVLTDPGYGREDSHPGEYLSCLGRGMSEAGHDLFLSTIPEAHSELSVIHKIVSTRRADGLILGWSGEAAPLWPPRRTKASPSQTTAARVPNLPA